MNLLDSPIRRLALAGVLLLLAACAAPPAPAPRDASADPWWQGFGHAPLAEFVAAAEAHSPLQAAALARVQQADAQRRIAAAGAWPTVTATLASAREGRLGGRADVDGTSHRLGLGVAYTVDLLGGERATRESADASLRASAFDRHAVRLATQAGAAADWLAAAALAERVALGERSLADAQRLLQLVEARARAGAATPLAVAQQRGIVATQQRTLAALRQQAGAARQALRRWTSEHTAPAPGPLAALQMPPLPVALPADLLRRRPDVARAEARLAAADADVAAARAAMFPSLNLNAGVGTGGARLARLLDQSVYSLGAALAAPIFDGRQRAAAHALSQARRAELLADYRAAIVEALVDAQTALDAIAALDEQRAAQAQELAQAERALQLAEARYRAGAETLLTLLDAQRTHFAAQDARAELVRVRLTAAVSLHRATGGAGAEAVP
ncbi:MAG: transporter [Variovorax paradoxus]|uniref:Transporter n=1 Tax=Variovorax paradoxus TaxID=34073 RepID=A0A2W5PY46_VARPD|nr:MAG: transporter [Variovorax paradoxus]